MNDLVNLVLPCLAPMVSDILGQLRALLRLKVVYFVLPHRCAIHGSKPPLTAAAALRSAWKPPRARKGRQGWRPGGVADMASYGRKKIAIVGIGNPQIDRKGIYHFNRIFLFYLFGGYYMLLEYCIPYGSLFFASPADLSWMMDALWQFDIAMKNGPFIWFITYQEYPKIVVFQGKR